MLLAHTGELNLTDAQVVKLAAISRRSEARRRSMRAAFDSSRQRFQRPAPGDTAARRQLREQMRTNMERSRDQMRADERDAIAVLTADQQARAWELVSRRGSGFRGEMRGMRGRGGARGMRGMRGMRQMRPRGRTPRFDRPGPGLRVPRDSTRRPSASPSASSN
jgi:hypothetical protein